MQIVLHNPAQAHEQIKQAWGYIKPNLIAGRKQVVEVRDYEDALTDRQRNYYHGYVLDEIAKQARPNGERYAMQVWKEYFREKYLGKKRKTTIDPMTGKKLRRLERISSESLGVKGYTRLIELVTAFAATELNVNFYQDFDSWNEDAA